MTAVPLNHAPSAEQRAARRPGTFRKVGRIAWALVIAAFAVVEGINHGTGSWLTLVAGLIAPDLSFLVGATPGEQLVKGQLPRRTVPVYNSVHRTVIPLVLAGAYSVSPLQAPALFTFLLAWMLHIAVDRIAGYGLRTREGFIRG